MKKISIIGIILIGFSWTFVLSLVMLSYTILWATK